MAKKEFSYIVPNPPHPDIKVTVQFEFDFDGIKPVVCMGKLINERGELICKIKDQSGEPNLEFILQSIDESIYFNVLGDIHSKIGEIVNEETPSFVFGKA